ncbi:MAG: MBL fold metallo-hydrolase [Thermoplasmata archaeon]|nr:MBL fold metallo-hydrolase [Thermoplasmata archaeon]
MKVIPLVSDSLGVRSLSVFVEFDNTDPLLIDGGARLGPKRYGLPPTELEKKALELYHKLIDKCVRKAGAVVISHYHYDHYLPDSTAYSGKTLYVKDPESDINRSQKTRGKLFLELQRNEARIIPADGREFHHGDITISFSAPVPHGEEDTPLGFVLMTLVKDSSTGETLLHTSDVQGPVSTKIRDRIIELDPDILIMDGAPTYLMEWKEPALINRVNQNLMAILDSVDGTIILDHHNLRDREWSDHIRKPLKSGRIETFAEFHDIKPLMLEAMRREIWRSEHGQD